MIDWTQQTIKVMMLKLIDLGIIFKKKQQRRRREMFTEFLHPDAVLFGEPINPQIKLKHPYLSKDGEIIVHQTIHRVYIPEDKTLKALRIKDKQAERKFSHDYEDLYQEDGTYEPDPQDLKPYESPDKVPDSSSSSSSEEDQEVKDYNHNPFADQLVGVTVDAGYLPQQINKILTGKSKKKSKTSKVPFAGKSEQKLQESPENGWLQDDDDDNSWVTQQQAQQFLINEQLQQVSGNFATDGTI